MVKENILEFAKKQIVQMPIKDTAEQQKFERKQGDLSKWFGENDTIEFDDSANAFLSLKASDKIFDSFRTLKLKVFRGTQEVNLNKEPFHAVSMINKCIISFFTLGE